MHSLLSLKMYLFNRLSQCLGSGFIGSARFWLPGSGYGLPDPQKYADPRIRIQGVKYPPKTAKKTFLLLKPKSELLKKRKIIKFPHFWMVHQDLG